MLNGKPWDEQGFPFCILASVDRHTVAYEKGNPAFIAQDETGKVGINKVSKEYKDFLNECDERYLKHIRRMQSSSKMSYSCLSWLSISTQNTLCYSVQLSWEFALEPSKASSDEVVGIMGKAYNNTLK